MPVVPALSDLSPQAAFHALRDAGLEPVVVGLPTARFDGYVGYRVAASEPAASREVPSGTRVALAFEARLLAWGPTSRPPFARDGTPAPDIVGFELQEAVRRLNAAGFLATVLQPKRALEELTVTRQEPVTGLADVVLRLD